MLEVSFEQLITVCSSIGLALTAAITFLAKWLLDMVNDLKKQMESCEKERIEQAKLIQEVMQKSAKLEGQVEALQSVGRQLSVEGR